LTNKSYTNLQYSSIQTKDPKDLTPKTEGISDSSPLFSSKFPDYVFFTRDGQIRYIKFPPNESTEKDNSILLTNYPIYINDFKIKKNAIIFSAEVYFSCGNDLACSAELIKEEEETDYRVYNSLFAFHWDTWLVEGKGSHIFYQKIKLNNDKIELDGDVIDLTKDMEINCPPLFSDNSNYDLSNDATKVAFSAHHRSHNEAWNTGWKTYYYDLNLMQKPILISGDTEARTQSPQFSLDDTKIAYLAMNTPMLESENLHFEIYNILTNKKDIISDPLDISVNEFIWLNDKEIRFTTEKIGQIIIYNVNIFNPIKPIFTQFNTISPTDSYGLPFTSIKNKNVLLSMKVGYDYPDSIIRFENGEEIEIVNLNKDILNEVELPKPELFNFIGGYNDTVYGWILKPINFNPEKTYPVALLIHGGPESSWTSGWSYRWNPQLFANQGYAVVMINPHGSSGFSSEFREAVRNDFGGVPYEDIINGLKYALENNKYMDKNRVCAAGGSYGGYMINWIEGHNDLFEFKCLVNHDGDFSGVAQFYGTDELWYEMTEYCPKNNTGCKPYDSKSTREGFDKFSPEKFVNNWKTPMLVIHGGNDYRVPLTEGLCTFTGLQLKKVESKFLYFPQENHWVLNPPNQVKWYEEVLNWFDKHTKE
jgi:dipeptidyl aminopeptidase/acylaminoacyl peptidase